VFKRIVFLSACVAPHTPGTSNVYITGDFNQDRFQSIILPSARQLAIPHISYVGHEGTAKFMSEKLIMDVALNRATWIPEPGDFCVCCRSIKRLEEGRIYTFEEMDPLFELSIMTVHSLNDIEFV